LQREFPSSHSQGSTSASHTLQQRIVQYGTTCVQPRLDYFENHFNSTQGTLLAFKAACYFSPQKINDIQPNAAAIDSLKEFPFLDSENILDGFKGELPSYLAKVSDIDSSIDIFQWWHQVYLAGQPQLAKCYSYNRHLQHQKECFHCLKCHSIPYSKVHCRIILKVH